MTDRRPVRASEAGRDHKFPVSDLNYDNVNILMIRLQNLPLGPVQPSLAAQLGSSGTRQPSNHSRDNFRLLDSLSFFDSSVYSVRKPDKLIKH